MQCVRVCVPVGRQGYRGGPGLRQDSAGQAALQRRRESPAEAVLPVCRLQDRWNCR